MSLVYFDEPGQLAAWAPAAGRSALPGAPIRIWARSLEEGTVRQLYELAAAPYLAFHVAAMADAHVAEGVAVGSVFATEHAVVPRALGGDLGCGMTARRLGAPADSLDRKALLRIIDALGRAIPAGDAMHRGKGIALPATLREAELSTRALSHLRDVQGPRHLGTLGGGNHFIELERDADGDTWLLVHSGSRGLGAAIAQHHASSAAAGTGAGALAGLDTEGPAGVAYLHDLSWALGFAKANRDILANTAIGIIGDVLGATLQPETVVELPHNFVARETWFGRSLWVHRKGAIAVPSGSLALIPGSMGTASYLVEGLGNPLAFGSCSHGAGRVMTRKEAHRVLTREGFRDAMRRVVYPPNCEARLIEESPAAYRDIAEVLRAQSDLVRRVRRLEPIAVFKG